MSTVRSGPPSDAGTALAACSRSRATCTPAAPATASSGRPRSRRSIPKICCVASACLARAAEVGAKIKRAVQVALQRLHERRLDACPLHDARWDVVRRRPSERKGIRDGEDRQHHAGDRDYDGGVAVGLAQGRNDLTPAPRRGGVVPPASGPAARTPTLGKAPSSGPQSRGTSAPGSRPGRAASPHGPGLTP